MRNPLRPAAIAALIALPLAAPVDAQEVRLRPAATLYEDAAGVGLRAPEGVAFDGSSLLVVADTGNRRLVLYNVDARSISASAEVRVPQAPSPVRVRLVAGGLLVLDGRSHRILRLSREGEFQAYVELPDRGKVDAVPRSFDVDPDGNLYILDAAGARVLVLGADGGLRREIAYAPEVRFLSDVTVGPGGAVFAVDSVGRRVFAARGEDAALSPLTEPLTEEMTFPTGIAAGATGLLFLADDHGGGVVILGRDGSFRGRESAMGWREGFLRYPSGLAAGKDLLFVADRGNNRVQVFTVVP